MLPRVFPIQRIWLIKTKPFLRSDTYTVWSYVDRSKTTTLGRQPVRVTLGSEMTQLKTLMPYRNGTIPYPP